ncbi:hypothetical protein C2845_PM13G02000 [Panicum miliaceum]|uniref:Uncharacterized protein n=1 Tax=Panicum miliaceum TaxID=4540 RepID=A0A3L6RKB2_PANMI|nr:hypothetical protein C2845_PM13G02000 [Panicum miliaceum]
MGLSRSLRRAVEPVVFDYSAPHRKCKGKRGARALMLRSELEALPYLRGDRLTIECVVDDAAAVAQGCLRSVYVAWIRRMIAGRIVLKQIVSIVNYYEVYEHPAS